MQSSAGTIENAINFAARERCYRAHSATILAGRCFRARHISRDGATCLGRVQHRLVPSPHTVRKETSKFRKMDVASKAQYVIETGHLWPKLLASVLEATHDRALAERKIRRAAELRAVKANKTTNGEESWNAVKGGTAWPFAIPLPSSVSTSKAKKKMKKNKEKKEDRASTQ